MSKWSSGGYGSRGLAGRRSAPVGWRWINCKMTCGRESILNTLTSSSNSVQQKLMRVSYEGWQERRVKGKLAHVSLFHAPLRNHHHPLHRRRRHYHHHHSLTKIDLIQLTVRMMMKREPSGYPSPFKSASPFLLLPPPSSSCLLPSTNNQSLK